MCVHDLAWSFSAHLGRLAGPRGQLSTPATSRKSGTCNFAVSLHVSKRVGASVNDETPDPFAKMVAKYGNMGIAI
jgi:hypothetical protein